MNERIEIGSGTPRLGFELEPLPSLLRGLNRVCAGVGIDAPDLSPERLVRAAGRRAGLPANLPGWVETALEVLCRSLRDDTDLHWFGRVNVRNLVVTGLAELLVIEDLFRRQPELDETELLAPLIVTGLPRSGTTFLHRLLCVSGGALPVELYRHLFPSPRRFDTARLEAELLFWQWRRASEVYSLDAIHFVRPGLPDECNFGMRLGMSSMIFWATAPTHSYLEWLLDQDLHESYRLYRRVLLLHQARAPGKRLTLKCPHHLAWLPALRQALPEAHIVQTHRDPLQALPSECKLIMSLHGVSSQTLDWRRGVASNRLKVQTFAQRSVAFAATPEGADVVHVDYRKLVADPVALAVEIHQRCGIEPANVEALGAFFTANRQHKHGKNHYSLAQFDLDAAQVDADFADYRERFICPTIEP